MLAPAELPKGILFEVLKHPSTEESWLVMEIDHEPSWVDSLIIYLRDGVLPQDAKEARKLRNQASWYILYEGKLYKRSYSLPLLKCLRPSEADYALWEVHEKICGNYLGARSLSHKLLRQGYYWPTCIVTRLNTSESVTDVRDMPTSRDSLPSSLHP